MEVNAVCNVSDYYVMKLRNKSVLEEDMDFVTNLGDDIFSSRTMTSSMTSLY